MQQLRFLFAMAIANKKRNFCILLDLVHHNITQFIYFWKTALHVSSSISTHHQEHTQLYLQYLVLVKPLLLPVAIVEELVLVGVWCGNCIDLFWCGCVSNRTKTDQTC